MLSSKTKNKLLIALIVLLLLADIAYSFRQYLANPLDWDMAGGLIPAENVKPVLNHPLGLYAIFEDTQYPNPNRFFSHWTMYHYFNKMPIFLQNFMSPIESVYWSGAIAKIVLHISFLLVLSMIFSGNKKILDKRFLWFALLLTPLFQVYGYQNHMGIIEKSNTYLFFYTLPMLLLLIYLLPFILRVYYKTELKLNWFHKLISILLVFPVCLSGPLNPGVILIFSFLAFAHFFVFQIRQKFQRLTLNSVLETIKSVPFDYLFFLVPASVLSIYSLYLGTYNEVNTLYQMPISEIYGLLPKGLFLQFFQKPAFPMLFLFCIANILIIKSIKAEQSVKLRKSHLWAIAFCILYIVFLPLGGYRDYRPFVLRYDTILPVTIVVFYIFASGSAFIISSLKNNLKKLYLAFIIIISIAFMNADRPNFNDNECEKNALAIISETAADSISLNCNCKVMAWNEQTSFEDNTQNAIMLYKWRISSKITIFSNNDSKH